jgi:hypothetical protein
VCNLIFSGQQKSGRKTLVLSCRLHVYTFWEGQPAGDLAGLRC